MGSPVNRQSSPDHPTTRVPSILFSAIPNTASQSWLTITMSEFQPVGRGRRKWRVSSFIFRTRPGSCSVPLSCSTDPKFSHMQGLVVSNVGNGKFYLGGYVPGKTQTVLLVKRRENWHLRTINSFSYSLVLTKHQLGRGAQFKTQKKKKRKIKYIKNIPMC